jgi:hypothetical protein
VTASVGWPARFVGRLGRPRRAHFVNIVVFVALAATRPSVALGCEEAIFRAHREEAHRRELLWGRGGRDVSDVLHDPARVGEPSAEGTAEGSAALAAVDGDDATAWRGAPDAKRWSVTVPFQRVVHLTLLRVRFGDDAIHGVPASYRWQVQRPNPQGSCDADAPFETVRDGYRNDYQGIPFLHGPSHIHALRQALFADDDACALRLQIESMGQSFPSLQPGPPVIRELLALEGARSIAAEATVHTLGTSPGAAAKEGRAALLASTEAGATDGQYDTFWAGEPGQAAWTLELVWPTPRLVDRVALTLGLDAVTVPDDDGTGRNFTGAYLPTKYRIETSYDDDPAHFVGWDRAPALPLRRRLLVDPGGRPVKRLRLVVEAATGPWGELDPRLAAPVVRDLEVFAEADARPVVKSPVFMVTNANPAILTHELQGGEASADGLHARDFYGRLRRILGGVDDDTRWPADATRPRTVGTGRFVEAIEGDDPTLSPALLRASGPPPTLVLSGAFDWEFDVHTQRTAERPGRVRWNVVAPAGDDGGMGGLSPAVKQRLAPMIGFCGGAQILALLTSMSEPAENVDEVEARGILDRVLLRNDNSPIRGKLDHPEPYERSFWFDPPALDASRPTLRFSPRDPLFRGLTPEDGPAELRRTTREIPISHGDMVRASAFTRGPLSGYVLAATSTFCRTWVEDSGYEGTRVDEKDPTRRCVTVPQAFRSKNEGRFPIVGFQFHPEQRDLQRLAPGSPPEARGDALNVLANTVDLVLEGYVRSYYGRQ